MVEEVQLGVVVRGPREQEIGNVQRLQLTRFADHQPLGAPKRGIVAARGTVDGQSQPSFAPGLGDEVCDAVIERAKGLAVMARDHDGLGRRRGRLLQKLKSVLAVKA
jgi:hypothetical protein